MSGLLCAGDLLIDVLDDAGQSTGYLPPVNATEMMLAAKGADTKERLSKMRDTYGQVLDSVAMPNPHEVTISLDDLSGEVLAMAFSGTRETLTQASGTVTDKAVTAKLGNWVELGHMEISAVTVKDSGGLTTYVEGTDYALNTRLGLLRALPGGAITDAQVLSVGYSHAAVSGVTVRGATRSQIDVRLKLDGINKATGEKIIVEVPRATLNADNEVDFLSEEFASVTLTGKAITLPGATEPYTVKILP